MMKVLVLSDSHGATKTIIKAVEKELPDYILHLGDNERDCKIISDLHPDIPLRVVRGNCDGLSKSSATEGFTLGDKRFLMTHGHNFYVKSSLIRLKKYADEQKPDIVLFGHTHVQHKEVWEDMLFINPGSVGVGSIKEYAVITINDGEVDVSIKNLSDGSIT